MTNIIEKICTPERDILPEVLQHVLDLAFEIAKEGREGSKIGTIFTVGDEHGVLRYSRPLILDPLYGHPDELKKIDNENMRETVKELALLDGAFVMSGGGVVISAARFLEAPTKKVAVPQGLGARHIAAAAISRHTGAIAVAVSASGVVRGFDNGEIVCKITS